MEPAAACASSQGPPEAVVALFMVVFILTIVTIAVAIKILIFCMLFSKAGYSWALGLLLLVPIANIIMAFYLAFADWPVRKELRELKQKLSSTQV